MNNYQAPSITDRQSLHGALDENKSYRGNGSDAEIKHGVQPVTSYEAPEISNQRDLDGQLRPTKSERFDLN